MLCAAPGVSLAGDSDAQSDAQRDPRRDVQRALAIKDVRDRTNTLQDALRGTDSAAAADAVIDLVLDEDAPQMVLGVGIRALGNMTSGAAQGAMSQSLPRASRFRGVLVAEALGRCNTAAARAQLESMARSDDVRLRAAAVTALGDGGAPETYTALVEALGDPEWTVRSAAARGLRALGDPRAIPVLTARLRKEDGRLLDDLSDALAQLTGKRYGPDPDAYDRLAGGTVAEPGWQAPPPSFQTPLFETRSRRVLFVISTAETMKDPVHGAAADGGVLAGVARVGQDLADDLSDAKTKLDVARVHLRTMIRSLADGVEFDVMSYSASPVFAFGQLTRADDASRRKAEARFARLSPGGAPDLSAALHRIFDPRAKDPLDAPDGPDTVVLITDGTLPTKGMNDRTEVGPREARWNRARQIRFVVVTVGQSEPGVVGLLAGGPPPGLWLSVP